jgi:3-hydroxyisobutyrate dehydrogenase
MLPSTKEVGAVYIGEGGIFEAVEKLPPTESQETVLIDSTTLDVDAAQNISRMAHSAGANMVDAPVSGGEVDDCSSFGMHL